jgi:hypothetical protein
MRGKPSYSGVQKGGCNYWSYWYRHSGLSLGEITPNMTVAVGQSKAKRIFIPVNLCENTVVGVLTLLPGN